MNEKGLSLSVLCSGSPMYIHNINILAEAGETSILLFKEQVPFKFKNGLSGCHPSG
jgi:hypothetical protein